MWWEAIQGYWALCCNVTVITASKLFNQCIQSHHSPTSITMWSAKLHKKWTTLPNKGQWSISNCGWMSQARLTTSPSCYSSITRGQRGVQSGTTSPTKLLHGLCFLGVLSGPKICLWSRLHLDPQRGAYSTPPEPLAGGNGPHCTAPYPRTPPLLLACGLDVQPFRDQAPYKLPSNSRFRAMPIS